eukprot:9478097-Pyramimonas_sp.AAC.1
MSTPPLSPPLDRARQLLSFYWAGQIAAGVVCMLLATLATSQLMLQASAAASHSLRTRAVK